MPLSLKLENPNLKIDEMIANFEKQIIKAGEEIVVLDNMHTDMTIQVADY